MNFYVVPSELRRGIENMWIFWKYLAQPKTAEKSNTTSGPKGLEHTVSFILHSFFSLDLMDFRTSKVIAFLTEVALLFFLLEFFNPLRRVEVIFLWLLNFLNPRKL